MQRDLTRGTIYERNWHLAEKKSISYFNEVLDNSLKDLNSDYEAKRYKNIALGPPTIHVVSSGVFDKWLKKKNKLGGQNKIPRLANNRNYLDDILSTIWFVFNIIKSWKYNWLVIYNSNIMFKMCRGFFILSNYCPSIN